MYTESPQQVLALMNRIGHALLANEARLFVLEHRLFGKSNFNPAQPRDDHGRWTGGGATTVQGGSGEDRVGNAPQAPESWARPETYQKHFKKHGKDFGTTTAEEYAKEAEAFRQRAIAEKLPAVENAQGYVKIYDPQTNTFGVYRPDGKTETFYKPSGSTYYEREVQTELGKGGRVINPLPARSGGGGGGVLDPLHTHHGPIDPIEQE